MSKESDTVSKLFQVAGSGAPNCLTVTILQAWLMVFNKQALDGNHEVIGWLFLLACKLTMWR
jgi:hypothetical protein